jgi:hypothetical protein
VSIYQPDVVIFLVGVNDWNRAVRLAMDSEQTAWLGKFPSSILGQMINEAYIALVKRSSVTGGVFQEDGAFFNRKRKSMLLPDRREYFPDDVSPAYAGELQDIANECQILKALCVFLTQPHGYHPAAAETYIESFWMTPPGRKYTLTLESMVHIADLYNQHLLEFARSNGFLAFDLAAHIEPGFQSFYDEVHFNTQGAKAVGDLVAQFLLAHPNQLADLPPAKTAGSVDY